MRLEDTITVELIVRDRRCVCVGGCDEVAYKVEKLIRSGARVEIFAQRSAVRPRLAGLLNDSTVILTERAPTREELEGAAVVFLSPDEEALGATLAEHARRTGTLVCTLDRPHASTFVNPGSADVSGLRVTVASGGAAPALVRRMREDLESILGTPRLAAFVRRLGELRQSLPRGSRGEALREKVSGFRLEGRLVFPAWWDEA